VNRFRPKSSQREAAVADNNSIAPREALTGDLAAFLNEVKAEHALAQRGRLVFGLDATASRNKTWDMAANFTAGMFREAAAIDTQPEARLPRPPARLLPRRKRVREDDGEDRVRGRRDPGRADPVPRDQRDD
jgi:hypothetical protein